MLGTLHFYYLKEGKNTTAMQNKSCAVYREGAVTDWTYQKWFAKFHAADFLLDDALGSGTPAEVDSDHIEILIKMINIIPCRR